MKFTSDPFATYRLLENELRSRGYSFTLTTDNTDRLLATYISKTGGSWQTSASKINYPFTHSAAKKLSIDKNAAYEFVSSIGVPVPFTKQLKANEEISSHVAAALIVNYKPLVVKPNDSSLSKGLTLQIRSEDALRAAIIKARTVNKGDVLVQQQVEGEEVRFIFVRGRVAAALLRQTPRVVGDGLSTIAELLKVENNVRKQLLFPYISYPQLDENLIDKKYFVSQTVPLKGEIVEFSKATMIKNGCSVYEILGDIHASYVKEFEKIAQHIDAPFFVADFLLKDYEAPKSADNHWFLEFNTSPVLKLCYGCRDGKMFDIVPIIADLIDETVL